MDPLEESDLTGGEPDDGHPVLLADWIRTDGLRCLKIKLRGNDAAWDYDRVVRIGNIAVPLGVDWLTADFNCTLRSENAQNDLPQATSDHICGQILKMLKLSFRRRLLPKSAASPPKCLNRAL